MLVPLGFGAGAGLAGIPTGADLRGDLEGGMTPAQVLTGEGDLVVTQGGAVALFLTLLIGGAKTDDGLATDQGGLAVDGAGHLDSGLDGLGVMTIDLGDDMPAVGLEALGGVVQEPARGVAVTAHLTIDGDVVVVVEADQLTQAQGTGEGASLVGDTLHQAAIAQEDIGMVIDDGMAGLVELAGEDLLRQGHAHAIGDALTQGTGGGLDAGGVPILGVARRLGVELAEGLEVLDAEVVPGEVQQGVDQHGAVPVGEHEAITVGPSGVGRIMAQVVVPQDLGDVSHAHGGTRMSGLGLLDRIHAQGADGIRKFLA